MNKRTVINQVLGLLFFGSLWGLSEASLGDWLYSEGIPYASIYLTAIACCIFALSKVFIPYRLTGTLTGLIALLFKLVNVPFFACHLLAIVLLGAGLDAAWALVTRLYRGRYGLPLIGLFGTYGGRALFALFITYVVRYEYWTAAGLPRVIDYIFISGTVSALIGAAVVPAGILLGKTVRAFSWTELHPRFSTTAVLVATLGIWIIQQAI